MKINHTKIKFNDYLLATDLSDYLVKKGIPFRKSHEIVGKIIRYADKQRISLSEIPIKKYKTFSKTFEEDIYNVIDIKKSIEAKKTIGSTSTRSVKKQISTAKKLLSLKKTGI